MKKTQLLSEKEEKRIASKILEYQITKRQLPLKVSVFQSFVKTLSKKPGAPSVQKIEEFLKPFVWFPNLV